MTEDAGQRAASIVWSAVLVPSVVDLAMTPSRDIARLLEIMAALRTPGTGCPWDLEQTFGTIAPYTIEEAYEVADAIARGDLDDLRDELGDLLLEVVFHARMAQEQGAFDFADVVESLTEKLVRRHPHVFGEARGLTPKAVEGLWERIKRAERAQKDNGLSGTETASTLAGIAVALPALTRDWGPRPPPAPVLSNCRQGGAGAASIGTPRSGCPPRPGRRRTRSRPSSPPAIVSPPVSRSATFCSRWSTLPVISTLIRKQRCVPPIANSSAASPRSNGRWRNAARPRRRRRSKRWTSSGTKLRPPNERCPPARHADVWRRRLRQAPVLAVACGDNISRRGHVGTAGLSPR